jgi:tripartite-type tricarboxylate transporter receptor subunit TctC
MRDKIRIGALATALGALVAAAPAAAQDPADFYRGKNVELFIGYSVGGGYDIYGRLVARHIGRFLPGNPTIVPRNMEGAGSVRLTNWLYTAAARDGALYQVRRPYSIRTKREKDQRDCHAPDQRIALS